MIPGEAVAFQFAAAGEAKDQGDLEAGVCQTAEKVGDLLAAELVVRHWLDDDLPETHRGCVLLPVGSFAHGRQGFRRLFYRNVRFVRLKAFFGAGFGRNRGFCPCWPRGGAGRGGRPDRVSAD